MGFLDQLKRLAGGHKGAVDGALDKATSAAEQKTGNKYDGAIREGEKVVEHELGTEEPGSHS